MNRSRRRKVLRAKGSSQQAAQPIETTVPIPDSFQGRRYRVRQGVRSFQPNARVVFSLDLAVAPVAGFPRELIVMEQEFGEQGRAFYSIEDWIDGRPGMLVRGDDVFVRWSLPTDASGRFPGSIRIEKTVQP